VRDDQVVGVVAAAEVKADQRLVAGQVTLVGGEGKLLQAIKGGEPSGSGGKPEQGGAEKVTA